MRNTILLFSLIISILRAQNCCLDNTFASAGIATTSIGMYSDQIRALKVLSDGKILAAGIVSTTTGFYAGYVKYNTNGSLDNSFGSAGIVSNPTGLGTLLDMDVQSDGKIVSVGAETTSWYPHIKITRINANGSPDISFGSNGTVTTSVVDGEEIQSLCIQSDGKYLVAGHGVSGTSTVVVVARYNSNGSLDNTFGSMGTMTYQPGINESYATEIEELPGGSILVSGSASNGNNLDFCVFKISNTGVIDNSFGINGIATASLGAWADVCNSMVVLSDGKIILGGTAATNVNGDTDFGLIKFNANGTIDNIYGNNGKLMFNIGQWDGLYDLKLQSNGKVVAGGYACSQTYCSIALTRFNADGSLDQTTFGHHGIITTVVGSYAYGRALGIQSDGNILIGAEGTSASGPYDFTIARYGGITTGIEVLIDHIGVNLFPNPVKSRLHIWAANEIKEIAVSNSLGQTVIELKNMNSKDFQLDVNVLPQGIYCIEITDMYGNLNMKKFIKE